MPDNRYLNVQHQTGAVTQIDVAEITWRGALQKAIKEALSVSGGYGLIQLYDRDGNEVTNLQKIPDEYYKEINEGGLALSIQLDPPASRVASSVLTKRASNNRQRTDSDGSASTGAVSKKRDRTGSIETDSAGPVSFKSAQVVDGCVVSPNQALLPYQFEDVRKLYVRKCYADVFDMLVAGVKKGFELFAITGTPGIGKSHFFIYVLHRVMQRRSLNDSQPQPSPLNPTRIIYQTSISCNCFDLDNQTVFELSRSQVKKLIHQSDTLYIINGRNSPAIPSSCVTLFIASPRSEEYLEFIKLGRLLEWYFPVWTKNELTACRESSFPDISLDTVLDRFRRYGGSTKYVFKCFHDDLKTALADQSAVARIQDYGIYTEENARVHLLLHMAVSEDGQYHYSHNVIASKYVGEQLWEHLSVQMIRHIQDALFMGSPTEICSRLFEIFGQQAFSSGGLKLDCRNLKTGELSEVTLDALDGFESLSNLTHCPADLFCSTMSYSAVP
ncbi:hypothetical protein HDU81_009545 [Chytriomyces hyalinus]|nr:hypothetical protein HDU81_009545 [Chytriomyces hyalinus]